MPRPRKDSNVKASREEALQTLIETLSRTAERKAVQNPAIAIDVIKIIRQLRKVA